MNENLLTLCKRPALWQRSQAPFWDDEHISEMMLDAHLNPNIDAASRKPAFIEASVQWLNTLFPKNAKVLDLGCGPGLYTKRFSELGYAVTGVDLSARSLAYAKAHDDKTTYIRQDYLTLDADEAYDVITLIYCDYAALTAPERTSLLAAVRRMLKKGGLFIFDVFTPVFYREKRESQSWSLCGQGGFWSEKPHLCIEATYLYENNTVSADQCVVVTKDGIKDYIIWDTVYTSEALKAEMAAGGLTVRALYGDVCGKALDDDCDMLCCVAAKDA